MLRTTGLAILVVCSVLSGCLGGEAEPRVCPDPELSIFHAPDGAGVARALGESVPILYWARNPTDEVVGFVATTLPTTEGTFDPNGPPSPESADRPLEQGAGPNGTAFGGFDVAADAGRANVSFQVDLLKPGCDLTGVAQRTVPLAPPVEDVERGEGGKGVLVHTVGWWTNGTSFYTNLDRFHDRADLPKGYGEYGGGDPLPVYVYNESRDEMPQRYEDAGYFTTIPGFNEALKGIPTAGARLAYLAPEQAYTRAGNEDHSLYGDPLIFYIEAMAVTTVPCELPQPVCEVPPVPDEVPCDPVCAQAAAAWLDRSPAVSD